MCWHPTSAILESTGSRIRRRLDIPKLSSEPAGPGAKESGCMTVKYPRLENSSSTLGETTRAYRRWRMSRTAFTRFRRGAPNVRLIYRGLSMDVLEEYFRPPAPIAKVDGFCLHRKCRFTGDR
jgi:hypothetical protein